MPFELKSLVAHRSFPRTLGLVFTFDKNVAENDNEIEINACGTFSSNICLQVLFLTDFNFCQM